MHAAQCVGRAHCGICLGKLLDFLHGFQLFDELVHRGLNDLPFELIERRLLLLDPSVKVLLQKDEGGLFQDVANQAARLVEQLLDELLKLRQAAQARARSWALGHGTGEGSARSGRAAASRRARQSQAQRPF